MNNEQVTHHGEWSGSLTFILAATGAAAGLGNIWKFPYIAGEHGGGAFVLLYVFFVIVIGIPIFMSELMLGKRGRLSPYQSIANIANEGKHTMSWALIGGLATLAGFLILSYYSVVAGEVIAYMVRTFNGNFTGQSADGVAYLYNNFRANPEVLLAWHTVFMVITCMVVARGVKHGLEKTVMIVMPLLVVMLLLMVAYSYQSDSFINGASFLFDIDFKKLIYTRDENGLYIADMSGAYQFTFNGILTAMGHAFFTLGIGVGSMIIFGSYLKQEISIARVTVLIATADTVIALLAGLAIFPIVFANGLSASQGPGLVFTTLPIAFGSMDYGNLLGGLFFLLLFFAALTSAIALLEPSVRWVMEKHQMTRVQATSWVGVTCWFIGIISVFSVSGTTLRDILTQIAVILDSTNVDMRHRIYDLTAFQMIDGMVTLVMLPLVGLLIAVFYGWIISPDWSREDLNAKSFIYKTWQFLIRYVTPILVVVIFVIGLLGWIKSHLLYESVF